VRLATRVGARRAGDGKQRASPSARGGDAHTAVRRGEKVHERRGKGGGVEEREASEAEKAIGSGSTPKLSWNGQGIPRF